MSEKKTASRQLADDIHQQEASKKEKFSSRMQSADRIRAAGFYFCLCRSGDLSIDLNMWAVISYFIDSFFFFYLTTAATR